MEEILEGIKKLETFIGKKQQWDVINEIDGNKGIISEEEKKDREKFKNVKLQLINKIDLVLNRNDFNQVTIEPETTKIHLYALKGCLSIINFDNIADLKIDMEKYKLSILKDIKYKTLEQEIEIQECEFELKNKFDLDENIEKSDEKEYQDNEELYQYSVPIVRKSIFNIFDKIKQFFQSKFGKNNRIKKQNMVRREELKYNKQSLAPLLEMENEVEKQSNFNDIIQDQKESSKNQKEYDISRKDIENPIKKLEEQNEEINDSKKEFSKRIKVNGKYAEWKNGNIVITDALPKKEDENIIE